MTEQRPEPEEGQAHPPKPQRPYLDAEAPEERLGESLPSPRTKVGDIVFVVANWYLSLDEAEGEFYILKHWLKQLLALPVALVVHALLQVVKAFLVTEGTFAEVIFSWSDNIVLLVFFCLIAVNAFMAVATAIAKAEERIDFLHEQRRKRRHSASQLREGDDDEDPR